MLASMATASCALDAGHAMRTPRRQGLAQEARGWTLLPARAKLDTTGAVSAAISAGQASSRMQVTGSMPAAEILLAIMLSWRSMNAVVFLYESMRAESRLLCRAGLLYRMQDMPR